MAATLPRSVFLLVCCCRDAEISIMKRPDGTDWQLGSGGFGTVYKAMRNGVQPVAVKILGSVSRGCWGALSAVQSMA